MKKRTADVPDDGICSFGFMSADNGRCTRPVEVEWLSPSGNRYPMCHEHGRMVSAA